MRIYLKLASLFLQNNLRDLVFGQPRRHFYIPARYDFHLPGQALSYTTSWELLWSLYLWHDYILTGKFENPGRDAQHCWTDTLATRNIFSTNSINPNVKAITGLVGVAGQRPSSTKVHASLLHLQNITGYSCWNPIINKKHLLTPSGSTIYNPPHYFT